MLQGTTDTSGSRHTAPNAAAPSQHPVNHAARFRRKYFTLPSGLSLSLSAPPPCRSCMQSSCLAPLPRSLLDLLHEDSLLPLGHHSCPAAPCSGLLTGAAAAVSPALLAGAAAGVSSAGEAATGAVSTITLLLTGGACTARGSSPCAGVEHTTARCGSEVAESEVGCACAAAAPASLPRRCLQYRNKPLGHHWHAMATLGD